MNELLKLRDSLIRFYKQYEVVIKYVFKFIVGFFIFQFIGSVGGGHPAIEEFLGKGYFIVHIILGLLFMLVPPTFANGLVALYLVVQVSSSPAFAILIFLMMVLILLFYGRMAPRESYLILGILIGFTLRIPFAVVLFAGLYMGLTSVIPISIGTFIWYIAPSLQELFASVKNAPASDDLLAIPMQMLEVFKLFFSTLAGDMTWIVIAVIFGLILLAVYIVSRLNIRYAKEISIGVGGAIGLFGMIMAAGLLELDSSMVSIIISSVVSVVLMLFVTFFDMALDYEATDRVQFQDDDYFYHVRIVPKIGVNREMAAERREETQQKPRARQTEMPPQPQRRPRPAQSERDTGAEKTRPRREELERTRLANEKREAPENTRIRPQSGERNRPDGIRTNERVRPAERKAPPRQRPERPQREENPENRRPRRPENLDETIIRPKRDE